MIKKILNLTKYILCSVLVVIGVLLIAMEFFIWSALDFSPYYAEIDRCLDAGHVWDDALKQCKNS